MKGERKKGPTGLLNGSQFEGSQQNRNGEVSAKNMFKPNPRKVLKMGGDAESTDFRCPALLSLRDLDNELSRPPVRASELSRASGDAIELRGPPVTHQDKVIFLAPLRLGGSFLLYSVQKLG